MTPDSTPLPPLPSRAHLWLTFGLFVCVALAAYGFSLSNGFVRWDDGLLIVDNPIVHQISPWSIGKAFSTYDPELYIPVTFLAYQIDWQIGGGAPWIFHLTSLALHLGSAWLLALTAYYLSRRWWAGVFVGLVFLVHPLNTEAVAWASGLKDVLSTFLWLLSLFWYVRYRDGDEKAYWWSVTAFALGLMAKATVIGLPVALLLIDWGRQRPLNRAAWTDKIPYGVLSVIFGIVAIFGKAAITRSSTLAEKIAMAGKSIGFYVEQLAWPHHLSALYPYRAPVTLTSVDFWGPWLLVLGLTLVAVGLLRRSRLPAMGWALFLLAVGPTLINFAKGGEIYFASDRYAYLGMIGLLLALASGLAKLIPGDEEYLLPQGRWRSSLVAIGGVAILLLSSLAFKQAQVWTSTKSLFTQVITYYSDAADVAHTNIGVELSMGGNDKDALPEFQAALKIRETAKPWGAIGDIARHERRFADAHVAYAKALTLEPKSPESHFGLALLLSDEGRLPEADAEYQEGLKYDPTSVRGLINYGSLLLHLLRPDEAIATLRKAIAIDPRQDEAYYNLGVAYGATGKLDEAKASYEASLRLDPVDIPSHLNLASVENALGNTDEAIRQLKFVLAIDPTNAIARSALLQISG